jgi:hypothetical protein
MFLAILIFFSPGSYLINKQTGQQVYLIGTAHISEISANQVHGLCHDFSTALAQ